MSMIEYNIISSGSDGNATIINKSILIDCGVSFRALKEYSKDLKIVLLTHIHSDHFCRTTVRKLANERPTLRWACCGWMVESLLYCNVKPGNIDILDFGPEYNYGKFSVIPFPVKHNVPNCGYKLHFNTGEKVFYATDCNNLNGISAKGYDLYLVEANYEEKEIHDRIKQKRLDGQYAYEERVIWNHLSKEKCDDWLYRNMKSTSRYVYMHMHNEKLREKGQNLQPEAS